MIAILDNLTSLLLLLVGFVLDNLIILAINPVGFILLFLSLILGERLIIKSIINDPNRINFKKIIIFIKDYKSKDYSIISPQQIALDMVFKKKNIGTKEISDNIGLNIGATRRLMSNLVNSGYIMREFDVRDGHAFCYVASDTYIESRNI